jgi:2-polyprenyl-3-methyl-5-hydroxy-6-metoxy-1,4-benzoquinol methylase
MKCRLCFSARFRSVLNLGQLALTGRFVSISDLTPEASVHLVSCIDCGMFQLESSCPAEILYGSGYGYESHLNSSMVEHLQSKAIELERLYIKSRDAVYLDIASNDGTLLSGYKNDEAIKIGVDPAIPFVSDKYPTKAIKIPDYFSYKNVFNILGKQIDLVTSCSVLYDLEDPQKFVSDISKLIKPGGIWHSEQSYLPTMLKSLSYDTICHEHLLYLTLTDVKKMCDKAGMEIIDARLNNINGGSIEITAQKMNLMSSDMLARRSLSLKEIEENELVFLSDLELQNEFSSSARSHMIELKELLLKFVQQGRKIYGLGASTKGNVLLQSCNLDRSIISAIGDINPKKHGLVTPRTKIPIVSESQIMDSADEDAILLVLPWHFKRNIIAKLKRTYPNKSLSLLFPLPDIHIVRI